MLIYFKKLILGISLLYKHPIFPNGQTYSLFSLFGLFKCDLELGCEKELRNFMFGMYKPKT